MDITTAYSEETRSIQLIMANLRIRIHRSCPLILLMLVKLFKKFMLVLIDMSLHSSLPKRWYTTFCVSVFDGLAMQLNAEFCGNVVVFFLTLP